MQAALAGWVAGYAVSIGFTMALLAVLLRWRNDSVRLQAVLPAGANRLALAMVLSIGGMLLWTLVGLVLGGVYAATSGDDAPGFGSPSRAFTAFTVAGIWLLAGLAAVPARRDLWPVLAVALVATACFGWLLPYLAEH